MHKYVLTLLTLVLVLGSCKTTTQTGEKMIIASKLGDCVGVVPMKCMLIKEEGQSDWQFFYSEIEGFEYEPGYEYEIEVKKETVDNPAADRSSIRYVLIKVLSKTAKESEGLPS